MSKANVSANVAANTNLQTRFDKIHFAALDVQADSYSFRDSDELSVASSSPLRPLLEDIMRAGGIHNPLLVVRTGDRFLLLDGYRRHAAIEKLIQDNVVGFTADLEVPANVIDDHPGELKILERTISGNVQRQPYSAEGRVRAAVALHRQGMPPDQIAKTLNASDSTVDRDLAVGRDERLMRHIREGNIGATAAASLAKLATDKGRMGDLLKAVDDFVLETQLMIEAEQRSREQADEKLLSEAKTKPQSYLAAEQVSAWKEALETGRPLAKASFRFKARVHGEGPQARIEIDALAVDVARLSVSDLAKVKERCQSLAVDLEKLIALMAGQAQPQDVRPPTQTRVAQVMGDAGRKEGKSAPDRSDA